MTAAGAARAMRCESLRESPGVGWDALTQDTLSGETSAAPESQGLSAAGVYCPCFGKAAVVSVSRSR